MVFGQVINGRSLFQAFGFSVYVNLFFILSLAEVKLQLIIKVVVTKGFLKLF